MKTAVSIISKILIEIKNEYLLNEFTFKIYFRIFVMLLLVKTNLLTMT